jgi:hypothetical protein
MLLLNVPEHLYGYCFCLNHSSVFFWSRLLFFRVGFPLFYACLFHAIICCYVVRSEISVTLLLIDLSILLKLLKS